MVGFIHHELFLKHLEGYPHVESPERLRSILSGVKASPAAGSISFIEAEPAESSWLERVHDRDYIDGILSLEVTDAVVLDWGDTVATAASVQAALHAAGAGVQAAGMVMDGKIGSAFCAVRPPGHHAERGRAMGFCIFNNIAVAAADLIEGRGLERVAIIDWDVHHGNGTERMFVDDDRVLYVSLHQYPHYPGTGHPDTRGSGRGEGFNINIPMGVGADDGDYIEAFERKVLPALETFNPEFILISAGFDAHGDDPLSGARLTSAAYGTMTGAIREVADRRCGGRIVSFLEGGYNLEALAESVVEHLTALI
jgi:acetoin utilization deacetylase AcuC-like enzyme